MKKPGTTTRRNGTVRCAIYTRKSSEEGLEQEFNSLQAQREACEAFIDSQRHEGWVCLRAPYDDGGFSGATMDRPALQQLLADVKAGRVDTIVVYKIDRLTRSLADFAKIVEILDTKGASFVSVTQQFNTTTSMGRLTKAGRDPRTPSSQLGITEAQMPLWTAFAQAMRDNAASTDALFSQRAHAVTSMSAVDNMHSYAQIARAYADNTERLATAFDSLYASLTDTQRQAADTLFREQASAAAQSRTRR